MKLRFYIPILILPILYSCTEQSDVEKKHAELKSKKQELATLRAEIEALESEIAVLDPDFARANRRATLITALPVSKTDFRHYVEITGTVKSRKNVDLYAETVGVIEAIKVKEGDYVKEGQVLVQLDNEMIKNTIRELQSSLELASSIYERQSKLWSKNIGTEVQYLEAKNRKETLETQLQNARVQLEKTYMKAPFPGTVDKIDAKIGMLGQPTFPLLRLVSKDNMYISAEISESYIGKFHVGDSVTIEFPSINKSMATKIASIGQVINPENRTFTVEVLVPVMEQQIKSNLMAVVRIKDFEAANGTVVPTNLIQKDNRGDFVYIVDNSKKDLNVARKISIVRGPTYRNKTLVSNGLTGDELLINDGFNEVSDGVNVRIIENGPSELISKK